LKNNQGFDCIRIFQEALDDIEEGLTINSTQLNNTRYADDTIMFVDNL